MPPKKYRGQGAIPADLQVHNLSGRLYGAALDRLCDEPTRPEDVMIRTVTLAAHELYMAKRIDLKQLRFLERTRVGAEMMDMGSTLNLYFIAKAYGLEHPKREVIRFPADWWEAFKERWAPCWFRTLYPVIYTEVTASLSETYPDVVPAMPGKRHTFSFDTMHRKYPVDF